MLFYVAGFYLLLPLLTAASLRWGGKSEQALAILLVLATVTQVIARSAWRLRYRDVEIGLLTIDLLFLIGVVWIAVHFRVWTATVVAAFQIIVLFGHVARATDTHFSRAAYALMESMSAYPTLVALMIGIWRHRRQEKRAASDISEPS